MSITIQGNLHHQRTNVFTTNEDFVRKAAGVEPIQKIISVYTAWANIWKMAKENLVTMTKVELSKCGSHHTLTCVCFCSQKK